MLRHTVSIPIQLWSCPLQRLHKCCEEPYMVEASLGTGFTIGLGREEIMYLACPAFGQLPRSPNSICQSVTAEESSECKRRQWPVRVTEARESTPGGSCFPSVSSRPAWFTAVNLQVPPATVAAAPTLGLPEASRETRSHFNQQDILTAPLTDSPCPS